MIINSQEQTNQLSSHYRSHTPCENITLVHPTLLFCVDSV